MMKAQLTLALALLLTSAGAVLAQTPDPCGDETGAAYGLCNAYVSAECQTATPSASNVACSRIAAKFKQITGRDLASKFVCPCVSTGGNFADFLAGQISVQSCQKNETGTVVYRGDEPIDPVAFSFNAEGQWYCGYTAEGVGLPISPAQGQVCAQLLEQAANSQGVTCTAP
jgi:hypothetical protein